MAIAIVGLIILFIGFIVVSAVVAAFVFGMTGPTNTHAIPAFTAKHINDTTIELTLVDMGSATSIKGLIVEKPTLTKKIVIGPDTKILPGQSIMISDPGLKGTIHLVAESQVDGQLTVVVDTNI